MAEYVALWGRDIETDSSPDPTKGSASNGHHDPITEPIPVSNDQYDNGYTYSDGYTEPTDYVVAEPEYADDETAHTEVRHDFIEAEPEPQDTEQTVGAFSYAEPFVDRRPGSPVGSLTFKPAVTTPWYRTRRGLMVLIAVIVVAVVLALVPLLLRGPADEPTNVTPSTEPAPSSVQPSATSVAPSLTSQPAPPPPPTPPPPPAQEAPAYRPQYPSSGGGYGSQAPKPEIGVTRTPISVAPKPVTPPTSAEVGKNGGGSNRSRW